jgi:hypothetical protein
MISRIESVAPKEQNHETGTKWQWAMLTACRMSPKIGTDFRKGHAQNQSATASFARPNGRAAL